MSGRSTLKMLDRLIGEWTTEASHPALPGVVVHGTAVIEWLEGKRFLMQRSRTDHADFPDALAVIGHTDQDRVGESTQDQRDDAAPFTMHYFDSRGVFRVYEATVDQAAWRIWRNAPGLSQRFVGSFAERDALISGLWQMCEDDTNWRDDLRITYRRA